MPPPELWQENFKTHLFSRLLNIFSWHKPIFWFIIFSVLFVGLIILTFYWALFKTATHWTESFSVIPGIYLVSLLHLFTTSNSLIMMLHFTCLEAINVYLKWSLFFILIVIWLGIITSSLWAPPSPHPILNALSRMKLWQDSEQTVWHIWALIWREFPWTENPDAAPETNKADDCRPDHTPDTTFWLQSVFAPDRSKAINKARRVS